MIKIGITGGIGSGKSVVARLLGVMDVPVYVSDIEAKRLMVSDPCIRQSLVGLLGEAIYEGGRLNKPLLTSYLFASPGNARQVNDIVHPRVKTDFRRWVRRHSAHPLVGIESAILIEAGFRDEVDKVLMVSAPLEVRIARAVARDHTSRQQVEQRIRSQMDDEEKRSLADYVVVNDGCQPLIPQVEALVTMLRGGCSAGM